MQIFFHKPITEIHLLVIFLVFIFTLFVLIIRICPSTLTNPSDGCLLNLSKLKKSNCQTLQLFNFHDKLTLLFNPFAPNDPFFYTLKTSENLWFF